MSCIDAHLQLAGDGRPQINGFQEITGITNDVGTCSHDTFVELCSEIVDLDARAVKITGIA